MNILTLDIESAPNLVHRWQLYGNDTTGANQIIEPGHLLCFAWKWHGAHTAFGQSPRYDPTGIGFDALYKDLNRADIVVTYNGKKYDVPRLNTAFLEAGLAPPKPYQHIDLYQVVRKNFSWPKMGLDYIAGELLGERKLQHQGHDLWKLCMAGDQEAWSVMEQYNRQDVVITEKLYDKLKPWIPAHPNILLFEEDAGRKACPRCGSESFQKRGFKVASTRIYQQYQCGSCTGWFRDTRSSDGATVS